MTRGRSFFGESDPALAGGGPEAEAVGGSDPAAGAGIAGGAGERNCRGDPCADAVPDGEGGRRGSSSAYSEEPPKGCGRPSATEASAAMRSECPIATRRSSRNSHPSPDMSNRPGPGVTRIGTVTIGPSRRSELSTGRRPSTRAYFHPNFTKYHNMDS